MPDTMLIIWGVLLAAFIIIEACTAQLVTIWFAAGALAALISQLAGAQTWLQWVIFIAVSIVALAATRPLVKKITSKKIQPTNADRCIGETAIVIEDVDNIAGKGLVSVNGITWTARSADEKTTFAKDERVKVESIQGVKLIVKAITNEETEAATAASVQ